MNNQTLKELCENYDPNIELIGSGNVDYGHNLADLVLKQNEDEKLKKRAEFESNLSLIRRVEFCGLNNGVDDNNREYAIKLIKIYGPYTRVNYKNQKMKEGEKGTFLEECSNYKLNQVLQKMYNSALKQTKN